MNKKNQVINYLSVAALEEAGVITPNQRQVDCAEACLRIALNHIGFAVFQLQRSGNQEPNTRDIRNIMHEFCCAAN